MRAIRIVIGTALVWATGCAQTDPSALLKTAVARIEQTTHNLKRFSCTETVERQAYHPDESKLVVRGISASQWLEFKDRHKLVWSDRFRLEFSIFDGSQLFSWPGKRSFDHARPEEFIGGDGASTAGEFGPFAINIFLDDAHAVSFEPLGVPGEYRYRVPAAQSRFLVRDLDRLDSALPFEGRFVLDTTTGDLKRLVVDLVNPPKEYGFQNGEIIIDYEPSRKYGETVVLLPFHSTMVLVSDNGEVRVNQTRYSDCREFTSVSSLVLEAAPKHLAPSRIASPPEVPLPAGIDLWTKMRTGIDTKTTFAGDRVEAEVIKPGADADGVVRVPKGALLEGRVIRLRRYFHPWKYVDLIIRFEYAEFDGRRVPCALWSRGSVEKAPPPSEAMLADMARSTLARIRVSPTDHLRIAPQSHWLWRTK